jgi:ketosteroid isomerase-like protein
MDRADLARASYEAFAAGDRRFFDEHLAADFTFSSPPVPHLDRAGWFERCRPGAGRGGEFAYDEIVRTEVYFGWALD